MAEQRQQHGGTEAGATTRHQGATQPTRAMAPRRILIIGANGLIGRTLGEELVRQGHEVFLAMRNPDSDRPNEHARLLRFDFSTPDDHALQSLLRTLDVLINAAGIFSERDGQSFDDVHVKGPCTLFEQAARAGVPRLIHISALGAGPGAPTRFWRSKALGDHCALRFPGDVTVVRPSLVFAPKGASTGLFLQLALLPVLPFPAPGGARVQPIHQQDLVDGLIALVDHPCPPPLIAAVGPVPLTLPAYLATLADALGHRLRWFPVAPRWMDLATALTRWMPGIALDADTMTMLAHGNTAASGAWQTLLGRPLRAPIDFVPRHQAPELRTRAMLRATLPLARAANAVTWLVTGWVSAFVYPTAASLALLAQAQVPATVAPLALYGAAALDVVLGLTMWKRAWRRATYRLQLALIAFYTVVITVWLPGYWAHPYGPIVKNLPLAALIYLLLRLEEPPRGHRRR